MKYIILLFASLASAITLGSRPLMQDVLKVQNPVSIMDLPRTSDPLDAYAPDCIKTVNTGAATVQTQLYEQGCALITFSSGVITRDYKFNCCGTSVWIRVNGADWEALRQAGSWMAFRYQRVSVSDNTYSIDFRKVNGQSPSNIAPEEFLP
ncbi:hypothetical protein K493DRAFT_343480 [Basidiobolus meristosporus CBS 931.73]|uniref:Uncharacterized protein n=1 Tax=Basidiobolus meristosporus CBS 931.73 TaxID=1314790 RepID=A0A1Y1VRC0_9FUNG|nr:hypothetical protein K493DRAFT_343480 [Basidiobolus meristosporus CBS 931.73]|eukprot:ORX63284.1 hypothetical protein K493DRAFT_343480 [Basidiobolus meristosporus CBS 931.73]